MATTPWVAFRSCRGLSTQLAAMVGTPHAIQTEIIDVVVATNVGPFIIETCD